MENICPKSTNCPIFNGVLKEKNMAAKSYQTQYCEAGEAKFTTCKRFIVSQQYGKCPPDLLPNSLLSIEQIATKYNLVQHVL